MPEHKTTFLEPFSTARSHDRLRTREDVLKEKARLKAHAAGLSQDAQSHKAGSPERNRLYAQVQQCFDSQQQMEELLQTRFLPQHSPRQLISPRAFFVSPLFRVCSKRLQRARETVLAFEDSRGQVLFRYIGPELRQSDGLVFMSLLNLVRDVRAGESVPFSAEDLCMAVFGRYDGPARTQLRDHIKRLQRGLVEFESASVQLCLRFDYPSRGMWSVALDQDIVRLFQPSSHVWLNLQTRRRLPEGLSTWLYAFVESQTRLIPTRVQTLREVCGSDASDESFTRMLRTALKELADAGIIDTGWKMRGGFLHWMKTDSNNTLTAAASSDCSPEESVI